MKQALKELQTDAPGDSIGEDECVETRKPWVVQIISELLGTEEGRTAAQTYNGLL